MGNSELIDSIMEDAPSQREHASQQEMEARDVVPDFCTMCGQEILCGICEEPYDGGIALEVDDPDAGTTSEQREARIDAEKRERALSGSGPRLTTFSR